MSIIAGEPPPESLLSLNPEATIQPLPLPKGRHIGRASALLFFACVSITAYWMAVLGIHGFKLRHPHGLVTAPHALEMTNKEILTTFQDPVFEALPTEMRRHILNAIDPEFAGLDPDAQYEVLAQLAVKYGPKPEIATALASLLNGGYRVALPMEPTDRIANVIAQSIPYGIALTAFVIVFAVVGKWLMFRIPSVSRPHAVAAGLMLVLGMTLYPPWAVHYQTGDGHVYLATYKYNWLFSPPITDQDQDATATVDWGRLVLAWLAVGIACTGAAYFIQNRTQLAATAGERTETPVKPSP